MAYLFLLEWSRCPLSSFFSNLAEPILKRIRSHIFDLSLTHTVIFQDCASRTPSRLFVMEVKDMGLNL
jgi:hypothetical protein